MLDHLFNALAVAGHQRGMPQQAKLSDRNTRHCVVLSSLEAGFRHARYKIFVAHTAWERRDARGPLSFPAGLCHLPNPERRGSLSDSGMPI